MTCQPASGLKYTHGSRDATSGFSRGTRNRRSQLGRKPEDAYELESGDDGELGKKSKEEDEAKLWSGNSYQRAEDPDRSIITFADREYTASAMGMRNHDWQSGDNTPDGKGINVVQELQISYGPSR